MWGVDASDPWWGPWLVKAGRTCICPLSSSKKAIDKAFPEQAQLQWALRNDVVRMG